MKRDFYSRRILSVWEACEILTRHGTQFKHVPTVRIFLAIQPLGDSTTQRIRETFKFHTIVERIETMKKL